MAVPCQRCGRGYELTMFEFGRTIWCTCGNRVGIDPRVSCVTRTAAKRFVADAMLGQLARWLRLLGFDCAYDPQITDEGIVRVAIADERTILTRDHLLPEDWWIDGIYVVREQELTKQLAEVVQRFDLASSIRVLTRCSKCNLVLQRVARANVSDRVPPRLLGIHSLFSECPKCRRVYWEGSHATRIRDLARSLVSAR